MCKEIFGPRTLGEWRIWAEYDKLLHEKVIQNLPKAQTEKVKPYSIRIAHGDNDSTHFHSTRSKEEAYLIIESATQMYSLLKYGCYPKGGSIRLEDGSTASKEMLEEIHEEMIR